jgi:hypothetical protein
MRRENMCACSRCGIGTEVNIWRYIQREKSGSLNSISREMENATDR